MARRGGVNARCLNGVANKPAATSEGDLPGIEASGGGDYAVAAGGHGVRAHDWFEPLPANWRAQRADAVLDYRKTPARTAEFASSEVFHYSIPAIQETGDGIAQDGSEIDSDKIRLDGGELIVSKLNPHKGCVLLTRAQPMPIVCSTEFVPLVARPGYDARFAFYVYSSGPVRELISAVVQSVTRSHQRANPEDIRKIWLPVPPPSQQRAIADYLDRETARLDALVAAKERVLGLLAEKRRALITRAVTRGLDPHAPLCDSGIHWLGEIPAHWQIWKLGHAAAVGNGSTPNRDKAEYWTEGTIPWLNSSVVNQEEVVQADQFVTSVAFQECHLPLVRSGSILLAITGQGKTRGQAVVLSFDATINQHLVFIAPDRSRLDSWFLRWTLLSAYKFLRSISDDAGGTKGALTCEEVANLRIPIPPLAEQLTIVGHIAAAIKMLDALRAATESSIALLKERRAALIAAAVTGKIHPKPPIA
jgi:type I restriction enzyme, S subunit